MLRHMFIVLLLVFETPVTSVTEVGVLWFLLIFLLWVKDASVHFILLLCLSLVWPFDDILQKA